MANHATATFNDPWAGEVRVNLTRYRTTRSGEPAYRYRWEAEPGSRSVVTGFRNGGFPTVDAAISAARRSFRFSNVEG